ncbi:hypothetical protein QBC40DRAFT_236196 [Triangularia verruculosa]|uniref:Uncharacterized protein n=1 Tax=Triangularia verruculosa TaxID=2587418 RepID=A0AAN7ANR1_9PEZI|nr:hypothetical protein QBC40DRAFT_236196 [Triangularia verruculosa]
MSFLGLDLANTNYSYYTIPAAFVVTMAPNVWAMVAAGKNYDLNQPRRTEDICSKDTSMPKTTLQKISRAKAATANGFETLSLYAASVVAANASGAVPLSKLNTLTLGYVASRAAYNFVYVVVQDNKKLAGIRPLVWAAGIFIIMNLFVSSGVKA